MSLRPIQADKLAKALARAGFTPVRKRGSHLILKHTDGRLVVIPVHSGEEIGRGLLSKIIRQAGLTRHEFLKILEQL